MGGATPSESDSDGGDRVRPIAAAARQPGSDCRQGAAGRRRTVESGAGRDEGVRGDAGGAAAMPAGPGVSWIIPLLHVRSSSHHYIDGPTGRTTSVRARAGRRQTLSSVGRADGSR